MKKFMETSLKLLLLVVLISIIALLTYQFTLASYDVTSVTPLFLMRFANYLMPVATSVSFLAVIISAVMRSKTLFIFSSFIMYFVVLFAPFNVFPVYVYNDQLGFALETLSGMLNGVIVPYQGEYATLGHAYFTTILAETLGLDLFAATRLVEAIFVFMSFVICLGLALSMFNRHGDKRMNLPGTVVVVTVLPAFILEPLIYSRGYFGLIMSLTLLLSMFKFMEKSDAKNSILTTITFTASSMSYPLLPLLVIMSMILFAVLLRTASYLRRNVHYDGKIIAKILVFLAIWLSIQAYLGYASWSVLHEIVSKWLSQEFFTALESTIALKYVGEAAIYVNFRMAMVLAGWLISALIALLLIIEISKEAQISWSKFFALSLIAMHGIVGAIYAVSFHEPGLRFYRSLITALPFAIAYLLYKKPVGKIPKRKLSTVLTLLTAVFLILSPATKWGWTFVGYPTQRDLALSNFIVSFHEEQMKSVYAPGSHELLWFSFESPKMQNEVSKPAIYFADDMTFNLSKSSSTDYTAIYYRIFIYPRWLGENFDTNNNLNIFASQNIKLYDAGGFRMLVKTTNS